MLNVGETDTRASLRRCAREEQHRGQATGEATVMIRISFVPFALLAVLATGTVSAQVKDDAGKRPQAASADTHTGKTDRRNCVRDTGSHIVSAQGRCLPVNGHSYSQDDIQRTGQTRAGPALERLDPSISVHGR
jgi:hypothetical protein